MPPETQRSGLRLLVVDDSELVRRRIASQLLDLDEVGRVSEAADVVSAVALLSSARPEIAVLDFHLAGGTALDVLREIRRQPSPIGVIVFTSHPAARLQDICIEHGADFFFSKSADFADVEDAVRTLGLRSRNDNGGIEPV